MTNNPTAMPPPDPSAIMQLATGYWASATLLAANELGLFAALANGPRPAADLARELSADAGALARVLDACCGLGLLSKQQNLYALTPASAAFLVPGRPGYLGSALRWSQAQYFAWGQLGRAVREGQPVVEPQNHLGSDPEKTRQFVLAMHERAAGVARAVIGHFDLTGCRRLLDVGGGPGTYAVLLAQQHPQLQVTVCDLPGVVAVARELVANSPVADRIAFLAADATAGDLGREAYDAILMAGVLHQMPPATIQRMLRGAAVALQPGGRIIVCDMMLDETGTQPVFSALFSLQMLLTSHGGATFPEPHLRAWLADAGFVSARTTSLVPRLPYTIVTGFKPGRSG